VIKNVGVTLVLWVTDVLFRELIHLLHFPRIAQLAQSQPGNYQWGLGLGLGLEVGLGISPKFSVAAALSSWPAAG